MGTQSKTKTYFNKSSKQNLSLFRPLALPMPTPWHFNQSFLLRLNPKTSSMTLLTGLSGLSTILETGLSMLTMTSLIGLKRLSMTLVMPSLTLLAGQKTHSRTHTTGPKNLTTGRLSERPPLVLWLLVSVAIGRADGICSLIQAIIMEKNRMEIALIQMAVTRAQLGTESTKKQ